MTERTPIDVKNLDQYGNAPLAWSRARDLLAANPPEPGTYFLGTVDPDGRPHAAGTGALWHDGDIYVVSGPGTRKSRNLAANPACTVAVSLEGMDLTFEGEATRVTDAPTLEALAGRYREVGWPVDVGGRRVHGPVHGSERRPAALVPLPRHVPHRVRGRQRRAARRDPLALRPLTTDSSPRTQWTEAPTPNIVTGAVYVTVFAGCRKIQVAETVTARRQPAPRSNELTWLRRAQ